MNRVDNGPWYNWLTAIILAQPLVILLQVILLQRIYAAFPIIQAMATIDVCNALCNIVAYAFGQDQYYGFKRAIVMQLFQGALTYFFVYLFRNFF